jgi:tRNA nucleotidyltransferase (CCA-adding enzyme)
VADLEAGIIRHTSPAFAEDPLRVLRAMQLAARLNMRLAPETAALARTLLPEAPTLAQERIWAEWHKWALKSTRPAAGLRVLFETGWLELYPELAALIGCPQDPLWHPEGDAWTHTLHVCDAAAEIADHGGLVGEDRVVLLLAALCHDLGKPATTETSEDGRIRSPGHAHAGVAPTEALLGRIGCPHAIAERVRPLVAEHMAHHGMEVSPRAVRRLAVRLAPATLLQWRRLVAADASGRPPLPAADPGAPIAELAKQLDVAHGRPRPILQGRHLLEAGMVPGPALGALLRRAYQAQIDGAFATVEEGLAWAARHRED